MVAGDTVELSLDLSVRLMEANPLLEASRNQVAVMRGPLVYCLESPDLPSGVRVSEVALSRRIQLSPRFEKTVLGGVALLEGPAVRYPERNWTGLYATLRPEPPQRIPVRLIPYYAWSNRGLSHMTVWIPLAD